MTLKQKSEYNIGENVVIFCNCEETPGIIADVKYDLGPVVQYLINISEGIYECRPANYIWQEEKDVNNTDAQIEVLLNDLDDIFDELAALSTPGHPVVPFAFVGIINGDRLDFHTLIPDEGESFEIKGEDEVDFSAAKGLPALSDIGLYDADEMDEDDDLPPPCADYPDCACGQMDVALYGHPLQVKGDTKTEPDYNTSQSLDDIFAAALERADKKKK